MKRLTVYLNQDAVGTLTQDANGLLGFRYGPEWLQQRRGPMETLAVRPEHIEAVGGRQSVGQVPRKVGAAGRATRARGLYTGRKNARQVALSKSGRRTPVPSSGVG